MVAASVVQVPAVLALAVRRGDLRPGAAVGRCVVLGALAVALVMGQLGALLDLSQWVLTISPFTHVPQVPAQPFEAAPVLIPLAVAAGLTVLGYIVFGRRDLRTT